MSLTTIDRKRLSGQYLFASIARFDQGLSIDIKFIMVEHQIDIEKEKILSNISHLKYVIYYYWQKTTIRPAICF